MDRRRAAGTLLALAACIATATAAPTASNHTALDLYDGAPDGCYYNFQHYGEGDRIMTNEPCLNCTCHNRMLMCYLRVCPFTKPIGQDCTIEKRADQCCPIVTCPDVPVDLLTSTTTSPAEYGPTGMGKLDKFGCSINGKYFSEGSKVPPTPNKPCEHCYCIRNMTTCVMQECTLHVDGCTPIYHKDVCCPVRYSCDHPEDEMPLLDDMSTTVRPTPGFLLTTTTISPVTQISQDCVYDNRIFPDGALIKTEKACDHCYCMKGDIVCVVQECGTPMENEGKNCTALPPREGVCCPDTYICEGDEPTTGTYETDGFTAPADQEKITTLSPPRRTSSEGSGYRNEPDEVHYTDSPIIEPEIEGSGEYEETKQPGVVTTEKSKLEFPNEILSSTEEPHEFIPLMTVKPKEEIETKTEISKDEAMINTEDVEKTTESQQRLPSTTAFYSTKDVEVPITNNIEELGSGEIPEDSSFKPLEEASIIPILPGIEENVAMTEVYEQDIITSGPELHEFSESEVPITSTPFSNEEKSVKPLEEEETTNKFSDATTPISTVSHDVTTSATKESTKTPDSIDLNEVTEETVTTYIEPSDFTTIETPTSSEKIKDTTEFIDQNTVTKAHDDFIAEENLDAQHYPPSTSVPPVDDEFVTTETQEIITDKKHDTNYLEPQHITASTPMLEEIEKDTTEYTETEHAIPSGTTQDSTFDVSSTTITNIAAIENYTVITESTIHEDHKPEDYSKGTTNIPVLDQREQTTASHEQISEHPIDTDNNESTESEVSSSTTSSDLSEIERKTTPEHGITVSEYDSDGHEFGASTITSELKAEEATTEPDKGLNTIPSAGIDDEINVSSEVHKSTPPKDEITTEGDFAHKFSPETGDIISSTISFASEYSEEHPIVTTETAYRKEDYSPTDAEMSSKATTMPASVTEEIITIFDNTKTTKPTLGLELETDTTLVPQYTQKIEQSTSPKEISDTIYESSTTEVLLSEITTEKLTTNIPLLDKETTIANQEDNEIFNEPRIPGEGDCLLNGVTYINESDVPSTNKCQTGCKCVSSIIKCDPIICSPPPEYMNNCETMYDTPDACCPTYICDHKTETIPPQSHSQMSGTEAPVISPVQCHGDECEISKDQIHHDVSSDDCKTGNCAGTSDESKETPSYPQSENIPEKPTLIQSEECAGDECKPSECTGEKNCKATPVQTCEGEKCGTSPEVILPESQQCAYGEDCAVSSIPSKECTGDNCAVSETQPESTHPSKVCTEEGCLHLPAPPEECNDDHCRRKDSFPLNQHGTEMCTTPDCKPTQTDIEISPAPALEQTSEVIKDDNNNKDITETTPKIESFTESQEPSYSVEPSALPETHEIGTKQPEITSDKSVTDIIELVTKPVLEITTQATDKQEITDSEFVTEKKETETEIPDYQSSVPTETTQNDSGEDSTLDDIEVETTDKSITQQESTDEKHHEEFVTTEKTLSTKVSDITEPTEVYTSKTQEDVKPTEEFESGSETPVFSEGSSTKPSVSSSTMEYNKLFTDIKDETSTEGVIDINTMPPKSQDDVENKDMSNTEMPLVQESSTIPSKILETDMEKITEEENEVTEPTDSIKDEKQSDDMLHTDVKPSIIDINEEETDFTKTTSGAIKYDSTTSSAMIDDTQSTSVSGSPDAIYLPEHTEHKDTPSDITQKPVTDSTKPFVTESDETTKSSENINEETTTYKSVEQTTIEPHYTEKQQDITPYQNVEETTVNIQGSITVSPKIETDDQLITKSPEGIEHDHTFTETQTTQAFPSEQKVTENIHHAETTLKGEEETSSKLSTVYDIEDQHLPEEPDHKVSPPSIYEESTETAITSTHTISEEGDRKGVTSEIPELSDTEPISTYPMEQEKEKIPLEIDHDATTHTLDESATEPTKPLSTELEISELSTEDMPSKSSHATETTLSYTTESIVTSKTADVLPTTTSKSKTESASEKSKIEDKTEKLFEESGIPDFVTTSQEIPSTSSSDELVTSSYVSESKITTPQEEMFKETTEKVTHGIELKPPQLEIAVETESPAKEVSTTPVPSDHDTTITISQSTESDQIQYATITPASMENDIQNIILPEQTLRPDFEPTKEPDATHVTEKDLSEPVDTEIQEPAYIPTESDELRTTYPQIYVTTTLKPVEVSKVPQHGEEKPELPEVSYTPSKAEHEQNTESIITVTQKEFTEEIFTGTEKLARPEEATTEKTTPTKDSDYTKEVESETESSQTSSSNNTEEPISKYTSTTSAGYDLTKVYPDEITIETVNNETKKPEIPTDDLIQSLVTESYETETKSSDDSQTQTSTHSPTDTPDYIKATIQQDKVADKPSISSNLPVSATIEQFDDKISITTESEKPVEENIETESPAHTDKIEIETTTQKKYFSESDTTIQELSAPEQHEIVTSAITEQKLTTARVEMPMVDVTTEKQFQETSFTGKQELVPSTESSVDIHEVPADSYSTTETPDKHTELTLEDTKAPDVQTQTEPSETVSTELPKSPSDIEMGTMKPISEEHGANAEDQKKQTVSTQPDVENKLFEPTATPKPYSEDMSSPSGEFEQTDKIIQETTKSTEAGQYSTEVVVDTTVADIHIEKQSDILQTVIPEKTTPIEEFATTIRPHEPELYQTATPASVVVNEMSARPSVSMEHEETTLSNDIEQKLPAKEQAIPVFISDTEKTATPEKSVDVQTESVIPDSEKPTQETVATDEGFISTLSPPADGTAKPIDTHTELYSTTAPEAAITTAAAGSNSVVPEELAATTSESFATSTPEAFVTKITEAPITTETEILITKSPEQAITPEPEIPVTTATEVSISDAPKVPEIPITNASEVPDSSEESLASAQETLTTTEPKLPSSQESKVPDIPLSSTSEAPIDKSEAPITSLPEEHATKESEAPAYAASEAPVPTTSEPEGLATNGSKVPISHTETPFTNAPEAPIASVPELHLTNVPEAQITDAPEVLVTNTPELPITDAPEIPKPVSTEAQPTEEVLTPDEEGSFPPSGGTSGYGQEPDYVEEDQTFGPGTCRYGGKVYVSAQQIPRDDPCDFCFCFRSDIICLQQSCPPPIHGCHEEPIQGFCCPRYECPVSMATTVNVTTTTTTTTTTLPPHFPTHSYKGSVHKRGCQIKGQTYKVGEVVRASSGPCLHCTCGGDGQMKCDPKVCTPEPMLRQMIAAAVSAKRRR